MKDIETRKRELVLESELNRQVLRLEVQQVLLQFDRTRAHWVHHAWTWAAPLAGFVLARRFTKTSGLLAKGSALLVALAKLWEFLQSRHKAAPG